MKIVKAQAWLLLFLAICGVTSLIGAPVTCFGQSVASEPTLPLSDRVTIDLAAGMPGQGQWLYVKDQDSPGVTNPSFADPAFNDSTWNKVGIPYSANLLNSFLNADSGGGDGDLDGTTNWYRLHFKLDPQYAGRKVLVEFEGAHTAAQVFINGRLLPGISAVTADASASHVVGFLSFIVDLTPYVTADGVTDNVLAVRVARGANWFQDPGFSEDYRFGQSDAGLFRPAKMYITNLIHIPENVYSNLRTWGTYVNTVSEVPAATGTATAASAVIAVQTNVLNESGSAQLVTLTTQIVDAAGNVVASAPPVSQNVLPAGPNPPPADATPMFDQRITVNNPTLWYPNNSTFGSPYLYKVYSILSVNGAVIDAVQNPLGIRTITWDKDLPSFNGHPMFLGGGSGRYDAVGTGSSVPEEQQWRDLAQMAAMGGNIWRPGHSSPSKEFLDAADAYGIVVADPSGEGEGAFSAACTNPPSTYCDSQTLKAELHRDMIIRDRNHPSVGFWESNNGPMDNTFAKQLLAIVQQWDPINPRESADRTPDPTNGYILGCTLEGCEVGKKNQFPDNPAWGAEYWGTGSARGAFSVELAFAGPFLHNWSLSRQAKAFAIVQWYFADTPGEDSLYTEFQQDMNTPQGKIDQSNVRSLGASMVDMNRFPKLLYYIYQAAWTPFSNPSTNTNNPVVHLDNSWLLWNTNNPPPGPIQVSAFSNCPSVVLVMGTQQVGTAQQPNPLTSDPGSMPPQTTTQIPFQVHWSDVQWAPGTITAQCQDEFGNILATDSKTTAGDPYQIVLKVVPDVRKPDGTSFQITANGSDTAFVEADVVDSKGVIVPNATNNLTFMVSGPATYMGGSEQFVSANSDAYSQANGPLHYHAPGDPELQAEAGMTKIAVRSQFTPGTVTVTATSPGLLPSQPATYQIYPVPNTTPQPSAPAIIVPPLSTAVTAGQPATFSVTASGTPPLEFQWRLNDQVIPGANSSTYTVPSTTSANDGQNYSVVVTNSINIPATSGEATLSVDAAAAPLITTPPASQTVVAGNSATFTVVATGSPTLTYQWQLNGANIDGATGPSYTTPVLSTTDSGENYTVVISNPVSPKGVPSQAAQLTVTAAVPPAITVPPVSQSVQANNPVTFSVQASGSQPLSYQWQKNGVNIEGANAQTLTIAAVQASDAGSYTVIVTNIANSATGGPATLTLAPPGINLALGQPATASSYQDPVGLAASMAFDGSLTTRWGSEFGSDNEWLEVDLGSVRSFNEAVLYWDPAFASQFQIQYSTDHKTWNPVNPASPNFAGVSGPQAPITFPTVSGEWVRMQGEGRADPQYGYSVDEFQIYNVAQCNSGSDNTQRYTVLGPDSVLDTVSNLIWQRQETTFPGTGQQYTQTIAQGFCQGSNMRLPTLAEALVISGAANASCAFPEPWETWTSTPDPENPNDAALVTSAGTSSYQVADNFPGGVLCTSGASVPPPAIAAQPTPQTVVACQPAAFSVASTSPGPLTYQWYKNDVAIPPAIFGSYVTPPEPATDNGAIFKVVVIGPTGETVESNSVQLTVTGTDTCGAPTTGTGGSTTGGGGGATGGGSTGGGTGGGSTGGGTAGGSDLAAIAAGSATAVGSFAADEDFSGGGTYSNAAANVSTTGVANAAPEAVYQSERSGVFTYTIGGLTNGTTYGVRLHFAEIYFTQTNQRVFNVSINNQPELTSFDIVAQAGGPNIALVKSFAATAVNGQITISFTAGSADQPKVSGIEITPTPDAGAIAAGGGAVAGAGIAAAESTDVVDIAAGSTTAAGNFAADEDFTGGGPFTNPNANVSTAGVAYAAPEAVYQSERAGVFTYVIPGLVPNATYGVRLHFAEIYWTQANQRVFNVAINKTPALTNFDIVAQAGGPNIALVKSFTVQADGNGLITIDFTAGSADQPKVSGIEIATSNDLLAIGAGSTSEVGLFLPDEDFTSGGTFTNPNANVSTAGVANAAPQAVYQSERAGVFTYVIPGLIHQMTYGLRLHFAEIYWTQPKQRIFNVKINNQPELTDFDIVAEAGGPNIALVKSFTATADDSGQITIDFTAGSVDQPKVSGIEVLSPVPSAGAASASAPLITLQPVSQTATIGTTAVFTAAADAGSGTVTYQWQKNGVPIPGATSATYITPGATAADDGANFNVIVTNTAGGSTPSNSVTLTVNSSPTYTVVPGFIPTDLNNNTRGQWPDNQIYVEILGINPVTGAYSWVNYDGTVTPLQVADNTAANALTGPDGKTYPNYAFTLAQSKQLKLPPLTSGRIFISEGSPLYMSVAPDANGYVGPNPQNTTDPNINVHYDWYEFTYGTNNQIYINTTQVDEFGLPLLLDVWGSNETFHMQTGINESIAALDQEFVNETPAAFHLTPPSNLRIFAPANSTFGAGGVNGNYFDSYIASVWTQYATNPLTVDLFGGSRRFMGTTQGSQFIFNEVNLNNGAYAGGTYTISQPTTQQVFYCNGSLATGDPNSQDVNTVELALEAQFCAAFNRHVMDNYSAWTTPAAYYQTAPANYYAQFWHNHSVGGLAYGFAYDDVNSQSSTITTGSPEHMAFGIGW